MYEYNAKVVEVKDGDTVELTIDLGFKVLYNHSCRLFGINTPEHGTPEGEAASSFLRELLPPGLAVVVATKKDKLEKYGRILGTITIPATKTKVGRKTVTVPAVNVNDHLVSAGHAKPWDGTGARPT